MRSRLHDSSHNTACFKALLNVRRQSVPERPVLAPIRCKHDQHVVGPQTWRSGKTCCKRLVERLLGFEIAPIACSNVDENKIVASLDTEIIRVVNEVVSVALFYELKA